MKRIIFVLLVSALFFCGISPLRYSVPIIQPAYAAEAEGGEKADVPPPEFEYVEMDPLSLPIITSKGISQQLSLLISLEVKYGEKEQLIPFKPRLADAYLQDLYGALGAGYGLMKNNVIDVQQLKDRLTAVTDKVVGTKLKVHGVLLQVVQQRQL